MELYIFSKWLLGVVCQRQWPISKQLQCADVCLSSLQVSASLATRPPTPPAALPTTFSPRWCIPIAGSLDLSIMASCNPTDLVARTYVPFRRSTASDGPVLRLVGDAGHRARLGTGGASSHVHAITRRVVASPHVLLASPQPHLPTQPH